MMTDSLACDNCGEKILPGDEVIRRGGKVYCCEACEFEAARSADCSGRADAGLGKSTDEQKSE